MPMRLEFILAVLVVISITSCACAQQQSYDQMAHAVMNPRYMPPPKSTTVPKTAAKAKPLNEKKEVPKHGVIRYDIFRDRNPYPVDPRKPCHVCVQREGHSKFAALNARIPGYQGRPYQDKEPGGCLCGKKKQKFKHLNVNVYWPTFGAGITEEFFPVRAANKAAHPARFKLVDIFDNLGGWEWSGYQRTDNAFCGNERERYGCLGESRQLESRVRGVGFREPGQPVARGGFTYP